MHTDELPTFEVAPLANGRWAISCLTCLHNRTHAYWTGDLADVPGILAHHARRLAVVS